MGRYDLLLLLNLPIVVFGLARAISMHQQASINRFSLALRLSFWTAILLSLIFSRRIYGWFYRNHLVHSSTLGVTTIILSTGILFSLFLSIRIYARLETVEKQQADLLTRLAILLSKDDSAR